MLHSFVYIHSAMPNHGSKGYRRRRLLVKVLIIMYMMRMSAKLIAVSSLFQKMSTLPLILECYWMENTPLLLFLMVLLTKVHFICGNL